MKSVGSARVSRSILENESHIQKRNTVWESERARGERVVRCDGGKAWLCVCVTRELNAAAEYTRMDGRESIWFFFGKA